jgi:hypothetical protein
MKRIGLLLIAALCWAHPGFAQTGGPVTVKAIDTATFATTDVGDNTNHALRVNIVAGAGSGGTALADNSAFTQSTTNETPAGGLFKAAYTAATDGRITVWRMNSTGSGYVNLDTIGNNAVVTGGTNGSLGIGGLAASGATGAGNPVKVGGVFNTTQPTVTTGQAVDQQMTARGAEIVSTGVDVFNVTVNAALPAGTNTIGAVKPVDACGTSNQDLIAQLTATTLTTATATTTCVDYILVTNIGAAQTTILVQDVSTACNSTVCTMIPTTPIAPNASMQFNLAGLKFTGGVKLQANNANNLQYFIHGRQ